LLLKVQYRKLTQLTNQPLNYDFISYVEVNLTGIGAKWSPTEDIKSPFTVTPGNLQFICCIINRGKKKN
jgi:hypothetical protein